MTSLRQTVELDLRIPQGAPSHTYTIEIYDYVGKNATESKSVAILLPEKVGKAYAHKLKELGSYNPGLTIGKGWVFSHKKEDALYELLNDIADGTVKPQYVESGRKTPGKRSPAIVSPARVRATAPISIPGRGSRASSHEELSIPDLMNLLLEKMESEVDKLKIIDNIVMGPFEKVEKKVDMSQVKIYVATGDKMIAMTD
jgi:hypothetical protein